jgi:hypothetical protein
MPDAVPIEVAYLRHLSANPPPKPDPAKLSKYDVNPNWPSPIFISPAMYRIGLGHGLTAAQLEEAHVYPYDTSHA